MKKCITIVILGCFGLLSRSLQAQTERIEFEAPLAYPEGVVYSKSRNVFYVSSVTTGTIGSVDPKGNYQVLYSDSALKSSFGMKLTSNESKLWVCVGDPNYSRYKDSATFKKMIRVVCIDIAARKKEKDIDLSSLYNGRHFANDLTFDNKGNIYITDSFSPVIYSIDANGKAGVFAESELFKSIAVGLNGITWHPKGFLLAVNNSNGSVLKIPIGSKEAPTLVKVPQFFPGADGLLVDAAGNLILVQNKGVNKVFKLSSTDNWATATVIASTAAADLFQYPSTATMMRNDIWIMNAKLNELSDSSVVLSKKFSIQRAVLK